MRQPVQCAGADDRLGNGVFVLSAHHGGLWVGAATGLWRWAPGEPKRYDTDDPNAAITLNHGTLLISNSTGLHRVVGETFEAYHLPELAGLSSIERILLDRDGGLWLGTFRDGLLHVHHGRVDRFTRSDGLSGNSVTDLFEDREGNIWVATNEGLDRFHEPAVTTFSSEHGLSTGMAYAVLPARDGSVWVGTPNGVTTIKGERTTTYTTADGLPANQIGSLFEDRAGRIFVASLRGTAFFDRGRFVPLRHVSTDVVYNIAETADGDLWINDQGLGLIRVRGEHVVAQFPWVALGRDSHATALVLDEARGGLWLGFYNGGVAFFKDGALGTSFSVRDGLGAGRISELKLDSDGTLWAATAGGLSRIKDNHVSTLTTRNGLACEAVHWTITDGDGALWLSTPCGLTRIKAEALTAWTANPASSVAPMVLDSSDGVRSIMTPIGFSPAAARLPDGRISFASVAGLASVDPRHLPFNKVPAPVHIEGVVANHRTYDTTVTGGRGVRLPALTRDLQIDYTGLSFIAPEKVRFRYTLEGHDRGWQDVGTRRQAFYTDLPPGVYRFRVMASNNSGVWNETGATLDFVIGAAYYQTRWFIALSVAAVLGLVWGAHRLRVRIVETHEREISALNERLMKAQEQERIRIAGELHDGVMQQMLAVTMMLGTAKRKVGVNSDATATIDKIQEKVIQAGTDIRQLSHGLHPPLLQEAGAPAAIRAYCDQFSAACGIPVSCDCAESARDLSRGAALALFRIVQEALGNAAKHAGAKQMAVRLTRSGRLVMLVVSDDGAGFDTSRLSASGGLGLVMMRERATQLNGKFEFESAPGRGTTIRVEIPFR
jgi:signal transduction histidine kinase/streptogramin lyase